jgi:AraC-like DNA-binding protein
MLPTYIGVLSPAIESLVSEQILDLLAAALAKTRQWHGGRASTGRFLVLTKIRAAIDARLSDPACDSAMVAAAAGISIRYANAVLADENTSIRRLLRTRRLARCRGALQDPLQAHRTVSEIAFSWGFSDLTHFGRKFKEVYGLLPSDCRPRAKAARPSE